MNFFPKNDHKMGIYMKITYSVLLSTLILCFGVSLFAQVPPSENSSCAKGDFLLSMGVAPNVTFEKWDTENECFVFQRETRLFSFQPAEFLCWGGAVPISEGDYALQLVNGGIFAGLPSTPNPETLALETAYCGTLDFKYDETAALFFPGTPLKERENLFLEVRNQKRPHDVLILRTGERLEGEFLALSEDAASFRTRKLAAPSAENFVPEAQTVIIVQKNISAVLFSTQLRLTPSISTPQKYFWVGLKDGSLFPQAVSGTRPTLDSISRETIIYVESPQKSQKFFSENLTSAAENIPELQWLDELQPSEVLCRSPLGDSGILPCWNASAAAFGTQLRRSGRIQRHGLGVTPGVTLVWTLDGNMKKLGVIPAIDDCSKDAFSASSASSPSSAPAVRFIIRADDVVKEEILFNSDTVPRLILVDISGAKRLELTVEAVPDARHPIPQSFCADWFLAFLKP